jgi:hypothetical protein
VDDDDILGSIRKMVDDEHELRGRVERNQGDAAQARVELGELQEALDQCWDLLRQRRAREEFDQDPGQAELRPKDVVEKYLA